MNPQSSKFKYKKTKPPKSFFDIPRFLKEIFKLFLSRLFYIISLVWETGPWILLLLSLISLLQGVLPIIGAIISKDILNELQTIVTSRAMSDITGLSFVANFFDSHLFFLLIFMFVYRLFSSIIGNINMLVTRISGELISNNIKKKIMNKAKTIDISSFDLPEFYEQLENANREASMRPLSVLTSSFSFITILITLFSYIIILSGEIPMAAVVVTLISIPSAIINFIYRKKHFSYMRRNSKERRQMNYYSGLLVNKNDVKEIRLFNLSDTFIDRYDSVFKKYFYGIKNLIIKENIWHFVVVLISTTVNCFFFIKIALNVFNGIWKIGDYSLYTGAIASIAANIAAIISSSASIYEGTLFIDNLTSFMKETPTIVPSVDPPRKPIKNIPHSIEFINVSFAYPGSENFVLKDINLKINPGETVVLVGLNGAGKTTLIKLLTRLYDPTEGEILLDGINLKEYSPADLYSIFGIIFQDFGRYSFTVSENIAFGNVEAPMDDEKIRLAAKKSGAEEYISKLTKQYETPLTKLFEEDGIELSTGQWQKLAVARAFYSESDILILDEPTASLDPMAEQDIFNQFDQLRKDKTTVFVSHRLSSATVASKIVVLDNGYIIEQGTHRELMKNHGKYCELFMTQAKRYIDNIADGAN